MEDEVIPVNIFSQSMFVPQIKEDRPEDGTREMCETARDTETKQTVSPVASVTSEFFQQTSINGPVFINSSSSKQKKVCWSLLFVLAVAASIFHFYYVTDKYLSYKTKTTSERVLKKEIQLPFVTFCNRNPKQKSKNNASNGYLEIVAENDKKTPDFAEKDVENMLLWCLPPYGFCDKSYFLPPLLSSYGACFTLNTTDFRQKKEGSFNGLDIGLFFEPDEYITEHKNFKGIQIVLHNTGTFPRPESDGFPIDVATQTDIALKKTKIKSLPWPYGDCVENMDQEYLLKYHYVYTYYLCTRLCQCKLEFLKCLSFTTVEEDEDTCDCKKRCSTNTFTYRITSSKWPTYEIAIIFLEYICESRSMLKERCDALKNQSEQNLLENFLRFKIYFDSMFVERVTDEPDVSKIDFLTELGGCIGLWIGLSIISVFEIFQFMVDLVVAIYQARQKHVQSNKP